jgi:hypothetical protein
MDLPEGYRKRSFLEFDVPLDIHSLLEEFSSIPKSAWQSSYWGNAHCSVGMLLLRGGTSGTEDDFWSPGEVQDHPHLREMPTFSSLLNGPFGRTRYAFIFRMRPNGVTLRHRDSGSLWQSMYRIHIPLITNADAFLISGERSLHLSVGSAWTFDNYEDHGVVNGAEERVHLIMDAPFNPDLQARIDSARHHEGECVPAHLAKIEARDAHATVSYPGDRAVAALIDRHRREGLNNKQISELLNVEKVPTKWYFPDSPEQEARWTPQMVVEFDPG